MQYTISDIAQQCNVSKATVSRIINNKGSGFSEATKHLVLRKMEELNYRPNAVARSFSVSSTKLIGMIIPDLRNPVQTELVRGVEECVSERGYRLILVQSRHNKELEQKMLISMVDQRVDGVILCSGSENTEFLHDYRRYHMPVSLIGRSFDQSVSDASITGDNRRGAILAMEHFFDRGHHEIALIDGRIQGSGPRQRMLGYKEALQSQGIPFRDELVQNTNYSYDDGFQMIEHLLSCNQKFTAVLTGGDIIAAGALAALRQHNLRVPEDVEVIGFDDLEISRISSPSVSTLRKPHYSMARMATKMLIDIIEGCPSDISHLIVQPELILRESTRRDNG